MPEIPQKLLHALSEDVGAMKRFAALDEIEKDVIIKKIGATHSAQEISSIVSRL